MDFLLTIGDDQGPSSNPARQPRSPPRDPNGPVPMETTFETELAYHAESSAPYHMNSVLKGTVGVCGRAFDCIIHTGASDTVLSHAVCPQTRLDGQDGSKQQHFHDGCWQV